MAIIVDMKINGGGAKGYWGLKSFIRRKHVDSVLIKRQSSQQLAKKSTFVKNEPNSTSKSSCLSQILRSSSKHLKMFIQLAIITLTQITLLLPCQMTNPQYFVVTY